MELTEALNKIDSGFEAIFRKLNEILESLEDLERRVAWVEHSHAKAAKRNQ